MRLLVLILPALLAAEEIRHCDYFEERNPPLVNQDCPLDTDSVLAQTIKGIVLLSETSPTPLLKQSIQGMVVQGLQIPGGKKNLQECLAHFWEDGCPLTIGRIDEIKSVISRYYREHCRPLMTIGVPEQDVTDGVVELIVIESKLGKITSVGNRWYSDSLLLSDIRTKPGEPIVSDSLLQDVAWLNRNPFRLSEIIFAPGEKRGTTDIELYTKDRFPVRFYIGGDNTGTQITGRPRFFTGFDWAWTFLFDQILSYQFTTSTNFKKFLANTIHYTAYLPWRHVLILYGGYSSTQPDIPTFMSTGYNAQGSLRYQIPLDLSPSYFSLQPLVGLDYKLEKTSLIFIGETAQIFASLGLAAVSQFMGGLEIGWEVPHHKALFQALFFWSPGNILPHQTPYDYSTLRIGATANYIYGRLMLSYRYEGQKGTLWLQGRGQKSTATLLQSEEFALGGYDTVRGYDELEFLADNAVCLNLELRTKPCGFFRKSKVPDELIFLAFVDYGIGVNQIATIEEQKSAFLIGIGPGVRYAVNPYFTFRLDYGFKLHTLPFGDTSIGKLHLGAILSY